MRDPSKKMNSVGKIDMAVIEKIVNFSRSELRIWIVERLDGKDPYLLALFDFFVDL